MREYNSENYNTDMSISRKRAKEIIEARLRFVKRRSDGVDLEFREALEVLLQAQEPEWIPCAERLPDDGARQMCAVIGDVGDGDFYATAFWNPKAALWYESDGEGSEQCRWPFSMIKYWLLLPESPKDS